MSRLIPPASALGLACVVVLSACGAGSGATGATSAGTTSPTSAAGNGQGGAGQGGAGQGRFPGVNGLVAAVDGQTLQVQGNGMQTAVIFTSATKFTAERPAKRSDVTVGSCVMVGNGSSGQSAASTPATPPTTEVAASVSITPAVAGSCTSGRAAFGGGPGGGFPGRTGGTQPTGQRTGGTGRPGGVRGGTFGQVTAVTATGFDVKSTLPNGAGAATATATPSTRVVHVTTTASTTYTRTGAATSAAAAVGTCVTATGTSDQTGALQARAINVRPAVDGTCSVGFGRQAGATTNG
jgi:hypothetical protein